MISVTLPDGVLDRILDASDPALRAKVLVDLFDYPPDDPSVVASRERILEQPWVMDTLAGYNGDGTWGRGFYHKYDGTSWVLLHLSEVGVPMGIESIRSGVTRLIDAARTVQSIRGERGVPFRDLQDGAFWMHPMACLTAHMALVLIRADLADHPVTRAALNTCRHRFEPGKGFGCFVMNDSLLPACVMTVPKVLKAFLALPAPARTRDDQAVIDGMVDVLRSVGLYQYVPTASQDWRSWAKDAPASERKKAKARWIAEGRLEPRTAKEGWLRFSFPHGYNSDLLEVLLLLGEAGAPLDDTVRGGLELLRSKQRSDGMWRMVGGLNGKMHGTLDSKGKPSPWITYRVLLAFKRFGLWHAPRGA